MAIAFYKIWKAISSFDNKDYVAFIYKLNFLYKFSSA